MRGVFEPLRANRLQLETVRVPVLPREEQFSAALRGDYRAELTRGVVSELSRD